MTQEPKEDDGLSTMIARDARMVADGHRLMINDKVDWLTYRMELAKELAVAAMSRKGCIDINELMDDVDGIIERLKGDGK